MPGQVNARLTPELDAEFDRWAAELGIQRGKLAHDIITEALAARREGRAMFEQPEKVGPGDALAMKAMLDRGVMEIDRISTTWAAHEADMRKRERDDQLALTRARTEFIAGMPERITASLNPIRKEMAAFAERIDKQPRLDAIDAKLEGFDAKLDRIATAAEQPKTVNTYTIGALDLRRRWYAAAGLVAFGLSLGLFYVASAVLPQTWLAAPTANSLLGGGDQAICTLVNYQFDRDNCALTNDAEGVRVKSKPPTSSQSHP
jgi:hypothetical protein